ncbi:MATE family efflux transporter [Cellulomonas citrea]|uniref:MATE family efflux transporter n=1 Tax=Cellulomonas citrea TaxID=1909423 RepID=UPI001359F408|nr:MATE family efflux transporter [Cellulomonas citrea]
MSTHDDRYYLLQAPMPRALAHLAVPMMAATSVGILYSVVNAGFVGSLGSTALLAAITLGLPLTALVMAVGGVFGTGGAAAVSRLVGELDGAVPEAAAELRLRIRRYSAFTVWGSVAAGAIVGALGLLWLTPVTHLLGADGPAFAPTAAYAGVLLAGTPVLTLAFAIEQLVRAEGAARASMTALIASTVVNFALDVLLILVLGWGVAGAALAIVASNAVTVGYLVRHLHRHSPEIRISPRWLAADGAVVREVLGIGSSELLMSGFMLVSSLLFNNVAVHYGDAALAGVGVAQRIVQVPEMLAMGVALGVMPLIAASTGAGLVGRRRLAMRHAAGWVAVVVAVFAVPLFALGPQVLQPFSHDPAVLAIGATALVAQLVSALFNGFTTLAVTFFQATGRMGPAAVLATAQGALFIPALLIGRALFGLTGVIWSITAAELVCLVLAGVLLLVSRGRQTADPTSDGEAVPAGAAEVAA